MLSRASLLCRRSTARPAAAATSANGSDASNTERSQQQWQQQRRRNHHHHGHAVGGFFAAASSHHSIGSSTLSAPPRYHHLSHHPPTNGQQIRRFAGRKDRASTSFETRKPTKKQRKKYHRRRRANEYEATKHSKPGSKAVHRRREKDENTQRLIEIAQEEEMLKGKLGAYFAKVNELQARIESSPKFRALLDEGTVPADEVRAAARDAAKKAAEKSDSPHPPLPTWWQDRMTYDWGDALVDDLMGNSADLTSSPSPYPVYMGGEYGRLRRKVERMMRGTREEERLLLEEGRRDKGNHLETQSVLPPLDLTNEFAELAVTESVDGGSSQHVPDIQRPKITISDKLTSDLIRAHRDVNGKRTAPLGLAASLQMLRELHIPLSSLKTYSYVSLLTCCQSPWEGRKLDELRRKNGVRSNEYYWSSLVDVYARSGDFRGAERMLDEMLDESQMEFDNPTAFGTNVTEERNVIQKRPIAVPPLPAYTSFFSACHKLISRSDVHNSIKSDAGDRAWARWKEMRIHSVAPDVMAYGALMRIFAAQGRPEQAVDLLDEVMMQLMMPVSADNVWDKNGMMNVNEEILRNADGDGDGWYDGRDGKTVRVKPTTLLFTSALRAVAKSHETANRFSGGLSKKNKKRESIASYHGRLTRKIVVLAEQAEVVQDDGFVAALMLCAAAAGDSSTARAVYLASKARALDHLRTCGGKEHLKRLQGLIPEEEKRQLLGGEQDEPSLALPAESSISNDSNKPALRSVEEEFEEDHAAYEHREYGSDTRVLSALLLAHSKAMEAKGLGSMWAGGYNRGYLCPNSLRYMESHNIPQKENMAIPGLDGVKAGLSPEGWEPEDFDRDGRDKDSKQLRKKHKFNIKNIMGDGEGSTRDDQDSFFDGFDEDPDQWKRDLYSPTRNREEERLQLNGGREGDEVGRDWLNDRLFGKDDARLLVGASSEDGEMSTVNFRPGEEATVNGEQASQDDEKADYFGNDFDSDSDDDSGDEEEEDMDGSKVPQIEKTSDITREGKFNEPQTDRDALVKAMAEVAGDVGLAEDLIPKDLDFSDGRGGGDDEKEGDFDPDSYFNEEEFNKLMEDTMQGMDDSKGDAEELDSIPGVSTDDLGAFKQHLQGELVAEGSKHAVDEMEARELFQMMRTYYDEGHKIPTTDDFVDDVVIRSDDGVTVGDSSFAAPMNNMDNAQELGNMMKGTAHRTFNDAPGQNQSDSGLGPQMQRSPAAGNNDGIGMPNEMIYADDYLEWANSQQEAAGAFESRKHISSSDENEIISPVEEKSSPIGDVPLPKHYMSPLEQPDVDPHIIELQQTLPGLPMNRIEKVSDEFARTLGYPSILRLSLAVRENMPEAFSPQCLTRVNLANAKHVMSEAEKEGLVDAHLLNGMLRVFTNSGRIEPALRFYDIEYKKHGIVPTTHSDRLLFEMLVKKRRVARAFKLKQDIESDGRSLDLLSYGTLVEHFGRHDQLGSALLLIKECVGVHGSAPGEKSLKNIRLMCRQKGLTDQVGLEKLVGTDPLEWMRRGEELKRVQNKRGKSSDLQYGMNRMLDI